VTCEFVNFRRDLRGFPKKLLHVVRRARHVKRPFSDKGRLHFNRCFGTGFFAVKRGKGGNFPNAARLARA
jgi:hypothetical protein